MIEIGVSKVYSTGKYRVWWREDGRYDEAKAYYTDDAEDAVVTLLDIQRRYPSAYISEGVYTRGLLNRYGGVG